jgi:hypothetical protein
VQQIEPWFFFSGIIAGVKPVHAQMLSIQIDDSKVIPAKPGDAGTSRAPCATTDGKRPVLVEVGFVQYGALSHMQEDRFRPHPIREHC